MDLVVTRGPGGFVVRQGGPPGPQGPPGAGGIGDVTQAELDAALALKQDAATAATDTELTDGLATKQSTSEKAQANGYASLDASAKVPLAQLTVGSMVYQGTWDVTTNTPTLVDGTGTTGDTYRVSVAGSRNLGSGSITYAIADFVLYNGTIWQKVGGSAAGISQAELDAAIATRQPSDTELDALAGLTSTANKFPYFTGSGTAQLHDLSAFIRQSAFLAAGNAAAAQTALALGTAAPLNVSASGNAAGGEVVKGNDTRLLGAGLASITAVTADYKPTAANELGAIIQTMTTPGAITIGPQSDTAIATGAPIRGIRGGTGGMTVRTAYRELVLADSPSLYWRFGEALGVTTAQDETANNRDGTYVGAPTLGSAGSGALPADFDMAVDLNGSTQYVSSTYSPFTNAATQTFEGWAWRDTSTSIDTLIGSDAASANVILRIEASSSDVRFYSDSGGTPATWTAAWPGTAQWVHWVLVFNESTNSASLYINGASVAGNPKTQASAYSSPGNFKVGAKGPTTADAFDGKQDEIAVYPAALSAARIGIHYDAGKLLINAPDNKRSVLKQNNQIEFFRQTADTWWLEGALA